MARQSVEEPPAAAAPGPDRLLSAAEVAQRLGVAKDWVYRRSQSLPFAVRLGGHVRFSAAGLERYLKGRRAAP
jgi:excisionase family DNA binding protein